jgi:hypothetical protein
MSRFHKLLEQEYLKLDVPPEKLSELQQNVVDKMVSSGKAKYEGLKKMNAVISYDVDGKKGKFKITPVGKVEKYEEDEDQEEFKGLSKLTGGSLNADDLRIARILAGGNAKGGLFLNRNPQKQIEQAYGEIVGKLGKKLKKVASQIKI